MTATAVERIEPARVRPHGFLAGLTTLDHKRIGVRYLITAAGFFVLAGCEALVMRVQLAGPDRRLLSPETYDQLFSMHGVTMIFLFVTPILSGFGNYVVPLQIGARDMAFPRLNALSYWVYLASGLFMYSSLVLGTAPNDGWFNYAPLATQSPGANIDFYGLGLLMLAISTTAGAINFIVTIATLRAPGMSLARMPLLCWSVLATSLSVVFALPALSADCLLLELQRKWGFHFFDTAHGGDSLLWQHLFWIFGHPDVYIIFLPAVGIVSTIIPVFSRRAMVAQGWVAFAVMATAFLGFGVWVHHMFAVGLPNIVMTFFAAVSLLIAIPAGIQVTAWLATILTGRPVMATPFLYVVGFIVVFVIGGLSGVMFAVIPFDQQVTDSYFVVAHFHYVLFGGAVFPIIAGLFFWLPKMTGRLYDERAGRLGFWIVFIGFNLTFFPMHVTGLLGMPRRVYTYPAGEGWGMLNLLSTIGAFMLAAGILVIVVTLVVSAVAGQPAGDDPWSGNTLEWATSSPPPSYNFRAIPVVRSANPNWDPGTAVSESDAVPPAPEGSAWPLLLALATLVLFVGLIASSNPVAVAGLVAAALCLGGWHLTEQSR